MRVKEAWGFLKDTFQQWSEDKASRLGAALAYYSIFSIGPLLVIAIAIAGAVFGREAAEGQVFTTLRGMLGAQGAQAVQVILQNAAQAKEGLIATALSVGMLVFGATGVFAQLQDSLNTIWAVEPKPNRPWWMVIKERFLSLAMVLGVGFLLMVSLLMSAALSAIYTWAGGLLPGADWVWQPVQMVVSFGAVTLMFALMYKYLPDAKISWHDVWIGAGTTAALFTIGKYALGVYLGNGAVGSVYGAAGSLVVVMVWVYYSAQIFFFGAEMTQVYANRYGARIVPSDNARPVSDRVRLQQGMAPKGAARDTRQPPPSFPGSRS